MGGKTGRVFKPDNYWGAGGDRGGEGIPDGVAEEKEREVGLQQVGGQVTVGLKASQG